MGVRKWHSREMRPKIQLGTPLISLLPPAMDLGNYMIIIILEIGNKFHNLCIYVKVFRVHLRYISKVIVVLGVPSSDKGWWQSQFDQYSVWFKCYKHWHGTLTYCAVVQALNSRLFLERKFSFCSVYRYYLTLNFPPG